MKTRALVYFFIAAVLLFGVVSPVAAVPTLEPSGPASPSAADTIRLFFDTITTSSNRIGDISMVMVRNTPWVAYYDSVDMDLKFAHWLGASTDGNCGPNNSWQCDTLATEGNVGKYTSLAFYPGGGALLSWKIGLTYFDDPGAGTTYIRYTYYKCYLVPTYHCGWSTPISVGTNGTRSSIKYDSNGVVHIAWYNQTLHSFFYSSDAFPGPANCSPGPDVDWGCYNFDDMSGSGSDSSVSLGLYHGAPQIVYYDPVAHDLRIAQWHNSGGNCGSTKWMCKPIETGGDVGMGAQILIPEDGSRNWTIAYYDKTGESLRVAKLVDGGGNCDVNANFNCFDVDTIGSWTDPGISMAGTSTGTPYIAYLAASGVFPSNTTTLKVATPRLLGNCGPTVSVPPISLHTWQCSTVDTGGGLLSGINDPAIGLDLTGKYRIAYDWWSRILSNTTYHLTLANQREMLFLPFLNQ
ncbi:MAG: hypothetical protein M1281_10060 [Chloroflexi bacterium]|nr:hypothetical protein [Chloroflexota bacterium]